MECYGGALSEMTHILAHELSSDHLAKPNSLPLNQSLKVLSTNNPPYQLHLQNGCVCVCVPGRQTACVLQCVHACLEVSVLVTARAKAGLFCFFNSQEMHKVH